MASYPSLGDLVSLSSAVAELPAPPARVACASVMGLEARSMGRVVPGSSAFLAPGLGCVPGCPWCEAFHPCSSGPSPREICFCLSCLTWASRL